MLNTSARTSLLQKIMPGIGRRAGAALLMALAARAALLGDLSPFATACFAAGLSAGLSPVWLLAGCALGCDWFALGLNACAPLLGCLLALGGWALARAMGLMEKLRGSAGRERFYSQDALVAVLAGLGGMLPPIALSRGDAYAIGMAVANGLIALALAPVLTGALALNARRTCLLPDERLSLALLAIICLFGLSRSPLGVLAAPMGALLTLWAAWTSAPIGAAVGILAGAALAFAGPDPMIGAELGLLGLLAGAAMPMGRLWGAVTFLLADVVTLALGTGELGAIHPAFAAGVGAVFCLVPEEWLERMRAWLVPRSAACEPDRLAARLRQATQKRVSALGSVFDELSVGYGEPADAPDEQVLIGQMRRGLCGGCAGYAACWNGSDGRAGRLLCGLLGQALAGQPLREGDELPPEVGRQCRRAAEMPRRLGALMNQFGARRRSAIERMDASRILARHFRQANRVLSDMGERLSTPLSVSRELSQTATAALEREGFDVGEALALDGDGVELTVALRAGLWDEEGAKRAAARLSQALAIPIRPAMLPSEKLGDSELRFVQSPRFSATVGYACRAKGGGAPSGDSHLAAGLTGGRVLLALSDGMGSGERAQRESAATIRLIRRFLLAEVDKTLMLDTVNQLLLLRGGEEMFATADLCVMDLEEGAAEFVKLGACASYVVRRGQCLRVEGGQLPLGILDSVSPGARTVRLRPGDTVVLFTDGVADSASDEQSQWLEDQLRALSGEPPAQLCAKLIETACARPEGVKDDMTVLAARIGRAR